MINIDFKKILTPINVKSDLSEMTFHSPQKNGSDALILVKIKPHSDQSLPDVYNLGFGPPNERGGFKDNVKLNHMNNDKVFSTILFHALTFLRLHPKLTIGIDGSDDYRTTLYHMMFKSNRNYLQDSLKH